MQTVLSPPTALWCADGVSVSIDGPGVQQVYQVDRPYVLLGASSRCDIALPLGDDLPVALYLHVTDDAIAWLDLTSNSGQWRSGVFYRTGCLVWRGYHIAVERIASRDQSLSREDASDAAALPGDDLADAPVFDIEHHGERIARAKLTTSMTLVGQSERCRLRLRNRHVSPDHCLYYASGRQAWVVDLLSREGTYVRGRRVAASPVFAGDVVALGKPTMTFVRWSRRKSEPIGVETASDSGVSIGAEGAPLSVDGGDSCTTESQPDAQPPVAIQETDDQASDGSMPGHGAPDVVDEPAELAVDELVAASPVDESDEASTRNDARTQLSATIVIPAALADPSLDRLIVRHKRNYRRTLLRWSLASSAILAAFLSAVVWGSRNLDFFDPRSDFDAESSPTLHEEALRPRPDASSTRRPLAEPVSQGQSAGVAEQPGNGAELVYSVGKRN